MLKLLLSAAMALGVFATAVCAAQTPPLFELLSPAERAALVAEGQDIAETQCRACHAVGRTDRSPRRDAPPLRSVLDRYDFSALALNLMNGVKVGHPDMPLYHMGPRGVDALVEYLYAIRTPAPQD